MPWECMILFTAIVLGNNTKLKERVGRGALPVTGKDRTRRQRWMLRAVGVYPTKRERERGTYEDIPTSIQLSKATNEKRKHGVQDYKAR